MARRNFGDGALRLLGPTTSTGWGDTAGITPSRVLTAVAQASAGTGSFTVQTTIDSVTWSTLIAATTYPTAGITVTSTSLHLFTNIRAAFTVQATTEDQSLFVVGR